MPEITYDVIKEFGVLSEKNGWTRELNYISWNGKDPKYDIRDWSPDHSKMGKGITLSEEELKALGKLIGEIAGE